MSKSNVKVQPKVRISQILEKKKREDPMGLITAQKNGTMAEFLAVELRAAGINPDSVVFGGNPNQNAGGSRTTSPDKADPPKAAGSPTKIAAKSPSSDTGSSVQSSNIYTAPAATVPGIKPAAVTPSTSPEKPRASPLGSVAKCPVCTKSVYKAEELVALGSTYHKQCFTCGGIDGQGCKRVLMQGGYEQQAGSPYCTACFAKLFKQGAARGGRLSGGSTVQPIADSASHHTLTAATTYEDKAMQPLKSYQNMNVNVTKLTSSYTESAVKSVPVTAAAGQEEEKSLQHLKSYQNMKVNVSQISSTFKSGAPTAADNNHQHSNFEYGFHEQKKSSAADKFRAPIGNTAKCFICAKSVFKMEEIVTLGATWHKQCFTCGGSSTDGCKRVLTQDGYEQQAGSPYCTACFAKLFKQGAARGARLSTSNHASTKEKGESTSAAVEDNEDNDSVSAAKVEVTEEPVVSAAAEPLLEPETVTQAEVIDDDPPPVSPPRQSHFLGNKSKTQPTTPEHSGTNSYSGSTYYSADKNKNMSVADKFKVAQSTANKCPCCTKTVYKAEEVFANGNFWHQMCFTCGGTGDQGCKRRLNAQNFQLQTGEPYCSACFDRMVKANVQRTSLNPSGTSPRSAKAGESAAAESVTASGSAATETDAATVTRSRPESPMKSADTNQECLFGSMSLADRSAAFKSNSSASTTTPPVAPSTTASNSYSFSNQNSDKVKNSSVADKFKAAQNMANKCPRCTKTVYKAEEVFANGNFWHQMCFTCGGTGDQGCKRRLNAQNFQLQTGEPYCSACFDRLVKAVIQKAAIPVGGRLSTDAASSATTSPRPMPMGGGGGTAGGEDSLNNSVGSTSARYIYSSPLKNSNKSELSKCKACKQNVYKMEEISAMQASWHKQCFTCDGCQKMLSADGYEVKNDAPYCLVCALKISSQSDDSNAGGSSLNYNDGGVAIDQDEEPDPISDKNNTNEDDEILAVVEPFVDTPDVHFDTSESAANSFYNGSSYNTSNVSNNNQQQQLQEAVAGATQVHDDDDDLEPLKADDNNVNVDPNNAEIIISGREKDHTYDTADDIPAATGDGGEADADAETSEEYTDVEFKGQVYRGYHLSYGYDFDDKGVVFWIGSKNKTEMFTNPHVSGEINVTMSSCYKGKPLNIVSRSIEGAPNYTENSLNSWIKIDLGPNRLLLADNYSLKHGGSSRGNSLRNWSLQAKAEEDVDDDNWVTLREHYDDVAITGEPDSAATWELDIPEEISDSAIGFRYFRIVQHGANSNGNNCLFCCGVEFYGVLFEKLGN